MQTDYWEFYASQLGKRYVLSLGMPSFTGSTYIRKKPEYNAKNLDIISKKLRFNTYLFIFSI